jgi:hypothetical protein
MSVTAKIDVSLNAKLAGTADLGSLEFGSALSKTVKITPGTATTAQADLLWADSRSLAASATENLDLAGGLTSAFGASLTFAEVTAIYFVNTGTTAITLGNVTNGIVGPFGAATHSLTIGGGDVLVLTNRAGWTITAGTADLLKVANAAGATGTYDIVIIGRSVAA